jgi:hypothetical protein
MGVERKAVIRYLNELKAKGIVVVTRRGMGKTNEYRLPRLSDVPKMGHQEVPPMGQQDVPYMGHKEYTGKNTKKEKDSDTSKFRKAHAKKLRDETAETGTTTDHLVPDQSVSNAITGAGEQDATPGADRAAAAAPNGSTWHSTPLSSRTPATARFTAFQDASAQRRQQGSDRVQPIGELLPAPRKRPPGTRDERDLVTAYYNDFVVFLGDESEHWSSVSQAINIFKAGRIPIERWPDLLLQAYAITKDNTPHIQKLPKNPGLGKAAKNRTPYFFEVLRDLCGLREESDASIPGTS